jgi:uncharacterized protein
MTDEVLEIFIRQYIQSQDIPVITFCWQGGEPTMMGLDFFKRAIKYQKKYCGGKKVENAFQTNGVLLDDEWCEFFANNKILVGLSIDGPEELNDHYRITKNGISSFKEVLSGLECLKKHEVEFNTLTVIQDHNSKFPIEIYRFLKEIGSRYIQFIPLVDRIAGKIPEDNQRLVLPTYNENSALAPWTVNPFDYGEFLIKVFDLWVMSDVGEYFIQPFDVALASWIGENPGLCINMEICGDALIMEHNGDLYSCDHFVYPQHLLGNIMNIPLPELVFSTKQKKFGEDKKENLPSRCLNCKYLFACHGGCPKHRFLSSPDGEKHLNYLCQGYKTFYSHIEPYMNMMANELLNQRAPANIMNIMH